MQLYTIKIRPRSPWRTPWQADTLMGALCTTCARCLGVDVLRAKLIDPMRKGHPPFVLSDAFPGDLLPIPTTLRLAELPAGVDVKVLKRAKWLSSANFRNACLGKQLSSHAFLPDPVLTEVSRHNTLSRTSGGSVDEGGLFARSDSMLAVGDNYLTLYLRAVDEAAVELLHELLYELSLVGFGADAATGRGQFDVDGEPKIAAELDGAQACANSVVVLSTFQPSAVDPTAGSWESFPKFGRLGPNLGSNDVRKNTMIMFRPGACFSTTLNPQFLGHAVSMDRMLPRPASEDLRLRGIEVVHPAFGLAIPAQLSIEAPR